MQSVMAESQELQGFFIRHVLDDVTAKYPSELQRITGQKNSSLFVTNVESLQTTESEGFFGVINSDRRNSCGRQEFEENAPPATDVQYRPAVTKEIHESRLDLPHYVFAASELI